MGRFDCTKTVSKYCLLTPDISISLSDMVPLIEWWLILFLLLPLSVPSVSELELIKVFASDTSESILHRFSICPELIISLFLTIWCKTSVGDFKSVVSVFVTIISHCFLTDNDFGVLRFWSRNCLLESDELPSSILRISIFSYSSPLTMTGEPVYRERNIYHHMFGQLIAI